VATDTLGWIDNAAFTTTIDHRGPLDVSISGQPSVTTDYYTSACADVTWTASATEGHPGYTYSWYIGSGTTVQGTGSTFTKRYCSTSQDVTVKAVARDSDGHTSEATFTTDLQYRGPVTAAISGPASVTTDSTTPCADVTWTASATSTGHSGFTYSWYIGTSTTVQGTGSTFTKRYCNTTQSVTVRLVARASDGHTDDVTRTTNITHREPLAASISGQSFVPLATRGECRSLTWTASATGGDPGYTYSWYIGTSTTVQGTGSTLTKTYCGSQTINVKVIASDTGGQSDDATFTTELYFESEPCPLCLQQ
jgi:hypothetical protein